MSVEGQMVPIADRVVALWSHDPLADCRRFLKGLDPEFFRVSANALAQIDGGKPELFAAAHIRMLRDQAAEMLFSLMAAAVQAPHGVALWLQLYQNQELDRILGGFATGAPLRTVSGTRPFDWDAVAAELTRHFTSEEAGAVDVYRAQHAKFWRRLAGEFLDPVARREYASLKHGLRVSPGGCEITVHLESSPGIKDPNAQPSVLKGSGFGSGFYVAERIGTQKLHYRLVHHHRHWTPKSQLLQIDLIVNSIQNVISHLRALSGEPGPFAWARSSFPEDYIACWRNDGPLMHSRFGSAIPESGIMCLTEEEMVDLLERPESVPPLVDGAPLPSEGGEQDPG